MSIPYLPGIPPLRTTIKRNLISTGVVVLLDTLLANVANQIWGIFDAKGKQVLFPDTFLGIDYSNNSRASDYPIESGSFASYNKISTPYNATITVAKGGTNEERTKFAASLDSLLNSFNLYKIITPDETFSNAVIETYSYERRTTNGANMIIATINFIEVRNTPSIQYSSTRDGTAITTNVPTAQQTNINTSTGLANPTSTAQASSQANINGGAVAVVDSVVAPRPIQ